MNDWVRIPLAPMVLANGDSATIKFTATGTGTFNEVVMFDASKFVVTLTRKMDPTVLRNQMLTFGIPPSADPSTATYASINREYQDAQFVNIVGDVRFINGVRQPLEIPNGDMDE